MTKGSLDRAVVVTGASTGIGRAAVAKAVREGAHVFASVRKQADADGLKSEFGEAVTPLLFDVADEAAVNAGAAKVATGLGKRRLFGLLNNAGIAVSGPLLYVENDDLRRQLETNLIGVHNCVRAFAPLLGADPDRIGRPGRIAMISSVGGKFGSPFAGPYSASKFALEGYSQSLRRELMVFGIDVIVIGPGAIKTPIWDKADETQIERLSNTPYGKAARAVYEYFMNAGRTGLEPSAVGDLVWCVFTSPSPKTRYEILRRPFMDAVLPRSLPARMIDKTIAQRLGLTKRA